MGETRSATVRWKFFKNGTNTPIKVDGLSLTIDDLDDGGGWHESFVTSDATGYTKESTSRVDARLEALTFSATGGTDLAKGDPVGAVKVDFATASSFTITYTTTFTAAHASSDFHHDGDGDLTFAAPVDIAILRPLHISM